MKIERNKLNPVAIILPIISVYFIRMQKGIIYNDVSLNSNYYQLPKCENFQAFNFL